MGKRKTGKAMSSSKQTHKRQRVTLSAGEVMAVPEHERTLEQWQTLPKQTLVLTAGALNLIQTSTAGALASRIRTFFLRGNQGTQPGHSSQAVQYQAQRDRDTRVIPQAEEARTQTHSGTDELGKLIREELTSFLGASGRPQPELIPALSEVSGEPESQHRPRPGEEEPQQQGQVHAEIHTHPGGNQQTVESTTRNPGRRSMLADEVSQYLEDVNELDNAIIKPTPNLLPLPAKIYKRIKNREYVDLNALVPQALYSSKATAITYRVNLGETAVSEGNIALSKEPAHDKKIKSFMSWLEGWNVFAQVTAFMYPDLAHELFAYQDQISNYNKTFLRKLG